MSKQLSGTNMTNKMLTSEKELNKRTNFYQRILVRLAIRFTDIVPVILYCGIVLEYMSIGSS